MAVLGRDTFTGTNYTHILDHIPDVGNAWLCNDMGKTNGIGILTNVLTSYTPWSSGGPYYLDIPNVADCYIKVTWQRFSGPRRTMLVARYNPGTGAMIALYAGTEVGKFYLQDFPGGDPYEFLITGYINPPTITMELRGSNVKVYYSEALHPIPELKVDWTTGVLAAGKCGFRFLILT